MLRAAAVILLSLLLAACAIHPAPEPVDVLLLGEQHDAPSHQEQHRQAVQALADQGTLAALALEMAEQGLSTAGLARDATPAAVQAALHWNDKAWPWAAYGPAVLAAVRAGVPVLGANLPRSSMRAAMGDATLDRLLSPAALQAQQTEIRSGHCGLLPETQILPMTRIQLARDRAMAQVVVRAAVPGKTVVLLAGGGHVEPALGVPQHLQSTLRVRVQRWPAQPPQKDYCEELRRQMAPAQ